MNGYLFPLLLILAAGGLFFGGTRPLLTTIDQQKTQELSLRQALDTTSSLDRTQDELLAKYNTIAAADRERLAKLLPDQVDNVRFIIDVNAIANRFGMQIKDLNIGAEEVAPQEGRGVVGADSSVYGTLTLGFTVQGSYTTVRAFLTELDRSLRIVDLDSIQFSADDKDNNIYKVQIRTYWLKS